MTFEGQFGIAVMDPEDWNKAQGGINCSIFLSLLSLGRHWHLAAETERGKDGDWLSYMGNVMVGIGPVRVSCLSDTVVPKFTSTYASFLEK